MFRVKGIIDFFNNQPSVKLLVDVMPYTVVMLIAGFIEKWVMEQDAGIYVTKMPPFDRGRKRVETIL